MYEQPFAHPYKKLGGWLLFFMIMNALGAVRGVFGLFGGSGIAAHIAGADWGGIADNLLGLGSAALAVAFVIMAARRDDRFLRIRQLGWLVSFVASLHTAYAMIHTAITMPASEELKRMVEASLGSDIWETVASVGMTEENFARIIGVVMIAFGAVTALSSLLFFFFITRYYGGSVRVRTYMGSDAYRGLALFAKNYHTPPAVPDDLPNPNDTGDRL